LKHNLNGTETGLPDDDQANGNFIADLVAPALLSHAPAEQLSEEAKPKQALFSHDGINRLGAAREAETCRIGAALTGICYTSFPGGEGNAKTSP